MACQKGECCEHDCPAKQLTRWSPFRSSFEWPSLSLIGWFDDQMSRMQNDLLQHRFFDIPEVGRIDLDPRRRSRLFDALFSPGALVESSTNFHVNPNKNQVECQLSTGCGDFFRPEDIELNVKDRNIEFKARREHKSEDGHSYTLREVRRVLTVPDGAVMDKLQAEMGLSGKVMLTAPLEQPKPIDSKWEKPIPIKINRS